MSQEKSLISRILAKFSSGRKKDPSPWAWQGPPKALRDGPVKRRRTAYAHLTAVKPSSFGSGTMPRVAVDGVLRWATDFQDPGRLSMLVVPGDLSARQVAFDKYEAWAQLQKTIAHDVSPPTWVQQGVLANLVERVRSIEVRRAGMPIWFPRGNWEIVWGVAARAEFVIDEPLRTIVDQRFYLAHDLYRLLWEIRFLSQESVNLAKAQELVGSVTRWAFGGATDVDQDRLVELGVHSQVTQTTQSYHLLCMLLTLASQNGLFSQCVLGFDGLEEALNRPWALREINRFLVTVDRWVQFGGCPIGVLLGFNVTPDNMEYLRDQNEDMAVRVEAGLLWSEEE